MNSFTGPVTPDFVGPTAFLLIGSVWLVAAIGWAFAAKSLGKWMSSETDGCLLGFCNVVLVFIGGGLGLLVAPYPFFFLTTFAGVILVPGLATLSVFMRNRRRRST